MSESRESRSTTGHSALHKVLAVAGKLLKLIVEVKYEILSHLFRQINRKESK